MYCQAAMGLYEKQNEIRTMIPKKSHLPKVPPTRVEQTNTSLLTIQEMLFIVNLH